MTTQPEKKNKPSAAARRLQRVREAFDRDALIRVCEMEQHEFSSYADRVDLPDSQGWRGSWNENFYFYKDNGSPILFVAHLDNVQWDRTCNVVDTADGPLALSGALDDRLGAYVGLELLPKLGIKCDILLTTNEEMGNSSAKFFETDKEYNWMIEFDRGGTDVVMYQYDTTETRAMVRAVGAHVGEGTYSDIADLDDLGCVGFNWGVGYYDYHSKRSHAWLDDTFGMVAKFLRFYRKNAATHLPWEGLEAEYGFGKADNGECPRCDSELDRWGCCWSCGYDPEYDKVGDDDKERVISIDQLSDDEKLALEAYIAEQTALEQQEEATG